MVTEDVLHHQNEHVIFDIKGISLLVTTMSLGQLYFTIQFFWKHEHLHLSFWKNLTHQKIWGKITAALVKLLKWWTDIKHSVLAFLWYKNIKIWSILTELWYLGVSPDDSTLNHIARYKLYILCSSFLNTISAINIELTRSIYVKEVFIQC